MVKDYDYKTYEEDLKMCNAIIKRYFKKYQYHAEDLRQEGIIGILGARERFNEQLSKKVTYLWSSCYFSMLSYIRKIIENEHEEENLSLNSPVSVNDDIVLLESILKDVDFDVDDYTEFIVIKDILKEYVNSLQKGTNIEKITKLTLLGYSSREIMEKLGCTVSYINRIKQEFKAKLKLMLNRELR